MFRATIPRAIGRAANRYGRDRAPVARAAQFVRATNEEPVLEMDAPHFLGEHLGRSIVALGQPVGEAECRAPPDEAVRSSGR